MADELAGTRDIVAHAPAKTAASAAGYMATAVSLWRLEAPGAEINNSLSFAMKLSRSEDDDTSGRS